LQTGLSQERKMLLDKGAVAWRWRPDELVM
jgi:hypothetical protein